MSCVTFKAAILRRPLNASPAMPKIYGSRGQTAVFRPRRINPWVNLCIKLTENASDASVFSVSLKRSFLTQVYPQIYFHSVPADKSRIPGIGKYCNTATAVSAVVFKLDTNTNFEVKRISHKRRKCSGFILTATKVRFCITDTVHFDWNHCSNCRNHCSNCRNQCSFILEYASSTAPPKVHSASKCSPCLRCPCGPSMAPFSTPRASRSARTKTLGQVLAIILALRNAAEGCRCGIHAAHLKSTAHAVNRHPEPHDMGESRPGGSDTACDQTCTRQSSHRSGSCR